MGFWLLPGGDLQFGPDGMLYWGIGDNTNGANAQDLSNIHGKILRLNPTNGNAPQDNPFINTVNAEPRIWAYGLRNPFRLEFTATGDCWPAMSATTPSKSWT